MRRVFILRPQPAAEDSAERARALGLEPVIAPLFAIEPLDWQAPEPSGFGALLLSSANAIRHAGSELQRLRGLPVHTVGEATAEAARAAGFDVASSGEDGVDRLLGSLPPDLRLLHLCGADRRDPRAPRQAITAVPVYRARALDTPDLARLDGQVAAVHSPRSAARLAELVEPNRRATIAIAAISDAAAAAAGDGWQRIAVPGRPTDAAVLALARGLCENAP